MSLSKLVGALLALLIAQSAAAKELVIGQVARIKDPLQAGHQMKNGIELYFDVVNQSGGVHGATLKLVARERSAAVAESVPAVKALLDEEKPIALIGLMGTGPMDALVKSGSLEAAGVPVVGIRTGATSLHTPVHPLLFHTRASYAVEANKIVRHLSTIGLKRIAVFYENTAFGKEALKHTLAALEKGKLKPIATATYELNTKDVAGALRTLQSATPEAVIAASSSSAAAELFKGLQQDGAQRIQMVTFSNVDAETVVKAIGRIEARGLGIAQVVPDPANRRTPVVREFQDAIKKHRDEKFELTQGAMEGYLAAKVLVEGLRRAGPNPSPAKVRNALDRLTNYDAGGFIVTFSPKNHSGASFVNIGILASDGKLMN